jgi:hypothetical protein
MTTTPAISAMPSISALSTTPSISTMPTTSSVTAMLTTPSTSATSAIPSISTMSPTSQISSNSISQHLTIMNKEEQKVCCYYCGKEFTRNSNLKVHIKSSRCDVKKNSCVEL